jgi:hypothetical protein
MVPKRQRMRAMALQTPIREAAEEARRHVDSTGQCIDVRYSRRAFVTGILRLFPPILSPNYTTHNFSRQFFRLMTSSFLPIPWYSDFIYLSHPSAATTSRNHTCPPPATSTPRPSTPPSQTRPSPSPFPTDKPTPPPTNTTSPKRHDHATRLRRPVELPSRRRRPSLKGCTGPSGTLADSRREGTTRRKRKGLTRGSTSFCRVSNSNKHYSFTHYSTRDFVNVSIIALF